MQIEARAEGAVLAVEDGDFGFGVLFEGQEGCVEFEGCGGVDGVAAVAAVDGYYCDSWVGRGDLDGVWFFVCHCGK